MADTPSRRLRRNFSYYGTLQRQGRTRLRTVKDAETLYHFFISLKQNNKQTHGYTRYLIHDYNLCQHRTEHHTCLDDWLANLPTEGIREMCAWEQFCRFVASLNGVVGVDARISIDGTAYEVDPAMAGETVILLWGLFDSELYIEFEGDRSGPYYPISYLYSLYIVIVRSNEVKQTNVLTVFVP